jgi:hypothetical protein
MFFPNVPEHVFSTSAKIWTKPTKNIMFVCLFVDNSLILNITTLLRGEGGGGGQEISNIQFSFKIHQNIV